MRGNVSATTARASKNCPHAEPVEARTVPMQISCHFPYRPRRKGRKELRAPPKISLRICPSLPAKHGRDCKRIQIIPENVRALDPVYSSARISLRITRPAHHAEIFPENLHDLPAALYKWRTGPSAAAKHSANGISSHGSITRRQPFVNRNGYE
jgi:hypothetical protein